MPRFAERLRAGANPLMLKAAQQSLRSRGLLLCGLIALLVPLFMFWGPGSLLLSAFARGNALGHGYFMFIASVLSVVMSLMLPIKAVQELNGEIKTRTLDLLLLTNLSPWELALGRFQAVLLELALLLSFVTPFAVAALGLGGIGARAILSCLFFASMVGCAQCAAGLLAMTTRLISRGYSVLALLVFAVQLAFTGFGSVSVVIAEELKAPWLVWWCVVLALFIVLCLRLTADILTSGNKSTSAWSKLLLWLILSVYLVPLWATSAFPRLAGSAGDRASFVGVGMVLFYCFVFIWSGMSERASSLRISRVWLLSDGYTATLSYAALSSVLVAAVSGDAWDVPAHLFAYFLLFTGLSALIHSLLRMRSSAAYFSLVISLLSFDLLACTPFLHGGPFEAQAHDSVWFALLPTLIGPSALAQHPQWAALPFAIGLLAVACARVRNARTSRGSA